MSAAIHTSRTVPVTVPRIARSLYSILFLCVSMFLLVLPATFLYFRIGGATERKRRRLHRFICRASRFIVRRVPGTCFTLDNSVGERFDKPAVIISNHQSHLDLMCILMLTPNLVVLTNDWVHRNPIYGLVIRYAEFYAVSDGIEANLGRLADLVRRGYSIVVFPEGTRSPDCRIGRFHRGAFYLAEQLHLDLPSVTSVFYIYLLKENFEQVPDELYRAAKVDGTSDLKYLRKVMVPICRPTIVTVTILKIIECWNSYVWPRLVTDDPAYYLVSNGIQETKG